MAFNYSDSLGVFSSLRFENVALPGYDTSTPRARPYLTPLQFHNAAFYTSYELAHQKRNQARRTRFCLATRLKKLVSSLLAVSEGQSHKACQIRIVLFAPLTIRFELVHIDLVGPL